MMIMRTNLYVVRDDGEYDYKGGFKTFKEANDYRLECQRQWMNHIDFVILQICTRQGMLEREINLTRISNVERDKILSDYGIPME